jgi:hypothetical protein
MKKTVLIAVACLLGMTVQAQETIKFDKTVHDFGNIPEKGEPVTYSFEFTNTGTAPLIIQNVQSSCGCTTPGWTREPVAPGQRGFVKATYAPTAAVSFDKTLTVISTGNPSSVILRIRGKAVAKMPTTEEAFPMAYGALRLKGDMLPMARIIQGNTKKDSIEVINTGTTNLTLSFANVPAQLTLESVPAVLKAGEKGYIRATVNTAAKKQEWGNVKYPVTIKANGKNMPNAQLTVSATIVDNFASVDYATAPIASVNRSTINFGNLKKGAPYTGTFELTNTGKKDLVIHKAESENPNLKIEAPTSLKPGEKATLTVTLNTKTETAGDRLYSVLLVTNAPNQSLLSLMLTGTID